MKSKRDEIRSVLNELFRETFDDDSIEISDETTAEDIDQWDSLMHITLVVAMEKQFGFQLNAEEVGQLKNVGEMLDILEHRLTRLS